MDYFIFCPNCGTENQSDQQLCSKCGKNIKAIMSSSLNQVEETPNSIQKNVQLENIFRRKALASLIISIILIVFVYPCWVIVSISYFLESEFIFLLPLLCLVVNSIGFRLGYSAFKVLHKKQTDPHKELFNRIRRIAGVASILNIITLILYIGLFIFALIGF